MAKFSVTAGMMAGTNTPIRLSPERDIAYQFLPLLETSLSRFKPSEMEDWIKDYMDRNQVDHPELLDGIKKLAAAMPAFARGEAAKSMPECLEKSGFVDVPDKVQVLLYAQLGAVMLGWYYHGVRECWNTDEQCPVELLEKRLDAKVTEILMWVPRRPSLWRRAKHHAGKIWSLLKNGSR